MPSQRLKSLWFFSVSLSGLGLGPTYVTTFLHLWIVIDQFFYDGKEEFICKA